MSIIDVKNLNFIRQIPVIGARIYEAFSSLQQGVTAMAVQANLNPTGQVDPPPAIQSVSAVGQNGTLHVSIEHTSADVKRGVRYYVEHADNPSFTNPQIRQIGDSRSFSEFVGSQARYVRAYAAYPGSEAGPKLYHGGAATPQSVDAGGSVGPAAYLPSQGSGTGAPGQGGVGPGPVQVRTDVSGFDWRLQRPVSGGGFGAGNSPGSMNGIGSGGEDSGGGGGGIVAAPLLTGSHANRLANFPSVKYPVNTEFYETDRTVWYWVQNASGTLTVAGGVNVTWVSGNHFINTGTGFTAAQWPANTAITIDGIVRRISVVNSATSITLAAAAPNGAGLSYSVASGRWVYFDGQYSAALASLPADLGENETILVSSKVALGFLYFENAAYFHQMQWNVSAWQRGPEDSEHSDTFHECGSVPTDGGWQACDGTTVSYLKYDGTTGSRILPNSNATPAYAKGGPTYNPALNAPSLPTFAGTPVTPAGTVSSSFSGSLITFTTDLFQTLLAGTIALVSPSSVTPSGSVSSSFSGSPMTPAGTIALPNDPVENFAVIRMYRL